MEDNGKIDPSSPYYLASGDRPGNLITHVLLRGDNYLAWSMMTSLKSCRKFVFVDGTINKPTEKKKFLDWDTVNSMIVSWIMKSMEPKIAAAIPYYQEAKPLWDFLAKKFTVANGPRLQQLRAEIIDCKQTKGMTMEDYYTKLMGLYDDFVQFKPLHSCECGGCACGLTVKLAGDRDEEKFHQFLIGVDDELYGAVRTSLISRVPLPSLDEAYLAFTQEEHSQVIARGKAEKETIQTQAIFALQASHPRTKFEKDKSKLSCNHCKQGGHDTSTCFKLHGIPEWYEELRSRRAKSGAGQGARSRGTQTRANVVYAPASSEESGDATTSLELNPKQTKVLLNMINNPHLDQMTGEFSALSWIIDTGASYHVTGDEYCLINPKPIHDVLLDEHSGSLNGAGEQKEGLYYSRRIPTVCAVAVGDFSTFELWHRRLGHPSDRVLKLVPVVKNSLSNARKKLNKACGVCPQAKQHRDSFPVSDSKASRIFELIHCDLWGRNSIPSSSGAHYFLTLVDDFSRAVWVYLLH
ncbi:uncharacterized protein [Spinacia oleracea]|uniref:GAG-pre-integrase domain-containing protein n=1 Tax=Spinacia oleracea TaxID=3562 RepID=A0ABM3QPZ4_SPIOL|nr:uncharacterized protein LOC130461377 [Spinacia oleracea]